MSVSCARRIPQLRDTKKMSDLDQPRLAIDEASCYLGQFCLGHVDRLGDELPALRPGRAVVVAAPQPAWPPPTMTHEDSVGALVAAYDPRHAGSNTWFGCLEQASRKRCQRKESERW